MEEYWDILDSERHPTGKTVKKTNKKLAPGEYHLLVGVYTFSLEGELLTTLRDRKKFYWPNMWECTGGSVWAGEDSETAARRELKEEIGLSDVDLYFLGSGQQEDYLIDCYLAVVPKQQLFIRTEEVADYRWLKESEYRGLCDEGKFVPVVEADLNRFWEKIQGILSQYQLKEEKNRTRTPEQMMELILSTAREDPRIRAVCLDGSRADCQAVQDQFSDFDIVYLVSDIRSFTKDHSWIKRFGELLILQTPDDWYDHPYDDTGTESFTYLMQFTDGNRIDLHLVDLSHQQELGENKEPRRVLLDKDGCPYLKEVLDNRLFWLQPPTEKEFYDCQNEFWWISLNTAKGLCREEFYYARQMMEHYQMDMLVKMLGWRVGMEYGFQVSWGKNAKYAKRYLTAEEMAQFQNVFAAGDFPSMWEGLFRMLDLFEQLSRQVGEHYGWNIEHERTGAIRARLTQMKKSASCSGMERQ